MEAQEKLNDLKCNTWKLGEAFPNTFFEIAENIYKQDQLWIKEDQQAIHFLFSQQHQFFNTGNAEILTINDQLRIAVFYNPTHLIEGEKAVFFGYWETINDLKLNKTAFEWVEKWAKKQGATIIYGPINFSTFNNYRLRTDDSLGKDVPFIGEPYHPTYYPELLSTLGFEKKYNYYSQVANGNLIKHIQKQSKPKIQKLFENSPYTITHLTKEIWYNHQEEFYHLIENTFSKNFAYTSISFQDFQHSFVPSVAKRLHPNYSSVVFNEENQIIGFFITYPHFYPLCTQNLDTPVLTKYISYDTHYQQLETQNLLLKTTGVHKDYQGKGIFNLMGSFVLYHFDTHEANIIATTIREDNHSFNFVKDFDVKLREYALYFKKLS